ncbi:MAG: hypothetical protein AAGB93_15895 [Planctomycetota bacterium]
MRRTSQRSSQRPSLALAALLPLGLLADTPKLSYDEGAEVTRTWTLRSTRAVDSATLTMNENAQDIGSGSSSSSTLSIEVRDAVQAVSDGAPQRFLRTIEAVGTEQEISGFDDSEGVQMKDTSGTSELVGAGVLFTFDPDAEEWEREYDEDSSGEEAWLEDLAPDMDLSGILPEDDVAVGETWDVPLSILDDLLKPGGELDVRPEDDEGGQEGAIAITIPSVGDVGRWHEMEGSVQARYLELVEEDGPRLARIQLTVDVKGELDLADYLEDEAAERGVDETYSEAALERTLQGKVTIDWDLAAGRFADVEGTLSGTGEFFSEWTLAVQGLELGLGVERSGTFEYEIEASIR